ncbi:MAG: SDR family NAD(P)-dependent oxidoreductase [Actinomycetota bacterium]
MSAVDRVVDGLLEAPIAPSFTRLGYAVRSRSAAWTPVSSYDATGRTIVLTGATSGLGLAAARRFTLANATLVILGRNADKTEDVAQQLRELGGGPVTTAVADMGELDDVRAAARQILGGHDRVDALIHNAGALSADRRETSAGIEATVASHVVGPHLLTTLLLDALADGGRVITMSSGGMYSAPLTVGGLQMGDDYGGSEQYARAKRAQVTLTEMWPDRCGARDIVFHSMHPGWADTPGVEDALPTFRRIVGRALRSPDEGADTMVWLALDDGAPLAETGRFWHDRAVRDIHRLPTTRRRDTPERRLALWDLVASLAGTEPTGSGDGRRAVG